MSAFAGFRIPPEVILLAVRWYLRYGLSYRDLEELLAERGIVVDHVTLYRWVQRFTPILIEASRPCRHSVGDRWFVDETYVKVAGVWRYVYRAVDQYGQVIDVFVSIKRDAKAARRFFASAIGAHGRPRVVTTDRSPALARAIIELVPAAHHDTTQYANNRVEADHGRLKARLRPMRGLKRDRTASVVIRGHAFMQNLRRAITNSVSMLLPVSPLQPRSMNWPKQSDLRLTSIDRPRARIPQRNRAPWLHQSSFVMVKVKSNSVPTGSPVAWSSIEPAAPTY